MMMNGGLKSVITINQTIDDPYSRVSGDVNGSAIRWIRENSHRYLGKYKDGVMYICQLDDSNSNYYHDGTPAVLTGAEGDVFMRMPNFYYCGTEGDVVDITFSTVPFYNCVPWMDNALIGVYEAYNGSSKMYSRSGVTPTGSISQQTSQTYAAARGTGYQLVDWQMHCVMGCLYYAMYGNTDCQSSIGQGTTSSTNLTGMTDGLAMTDTVAGGNGDGQFINYWGLENWWGNKYEFLHDCIIPSNSLYANVYDPVNGGTRSFRVFPYNMYYPTKMKFGRYLDLIATNDDSNNMNGKIGYCDQQAWAALPSSDPIATRHSRHDSKESLGVACAFAIYSNSYAHPASGSRMAFRGSLVEETDVQTFKSIDVTN